MWRIPEGAKGAMLSFAIRLTAIAQFTFAVLVTPSFPQAADPSQAAGVERKKSIRNSTER